jgi:hypothetical protein
MIVEGVFSEKYLNSLDCYRASQQATSAYVALHLAWHTPRWSSLLPGTASNFSGAFLAHYLFFRSRVAANVNFFQTQRATFFTRSIPLCRSCS